MNHQNKLMNILYNRTFLNKTLNKTMKHSYIYILVMTALLSSCGFYGNYERNTQKVDSLTNGLYRDPIALNAPLDVNDTVSFGNTPWQEVFTDDKLQELITKALDQNIDLLKLDNTLQTVDIAMRLSKMAYLPQVALSPSGTISKVFDMGMDNSQTYGIPVQASWQIDVWGTLRNALKQNSLSREQAILGKQAAQTGVICGVASLYYGLQMLDEQLATTKTTLDIWRKEVQVMEGYKDIGYTNSAAIASAKAQVLSIESSVISIESKQRELEGQLCNLLGESSHAIERNPFTAEGFPEKFSTGYPIALLANRPDVAIAEKKLASATYGVMKARGQMCPQLTISGSGQFTNSLGGMVVNPGKFIAAGVAGLTQPIFARGQLLGNLKMSKIDLENAELDFTKSLLNAGLEVSNALLAYHDATELIDISEKQVAELQRAYDDTEYLFHHGNTTTYLEILNSQMNLLQGKLGLINNRYSKVVAAITLYQALGGGASQLNNESEENKEEES